LTSGLAGSLPSPLSFFFSFFPGARPFQFPLSRSFFFERTFAANLPFSTLFIFLLYLITRLDPVDLPRWGLIFFFDSIPSFLPFVSITHVPITFSPFFFFWPCWLFRDGRAFGTFYTPPPDAQGRNPPLSGRIGLSPRF